MWLKFLGGFLAIVLAFMAYVAYLPGHFRVERTVKIQALASTIFSHVSDLRATDAWNPFMKLDPKAEKTFSPQSSGVGATYSWASPGNRGRATITELRPNELVVTRLDFKEPFPGTQLSTYALVAEGNATLVRWSIEGETHFVPRALGALRIFDIEKIIGDAFEKGLGELKGIVERK